MKTYNVGATVPIYDRETGKRVNGVIASTRSNMSLVYIGEHKSQWIDNETLATIEKTVLPND